MTVTVTTESGSCYEFEGTRVRRVNMTHGMRRDDMWLECRMYEEPVVGESMTLVLEPLAEGADATVRRTSRVVAVS